MSTGQQHASAPALGVVSAQVLIAAPGAGLKIIVRQIAIGVGAAATKVTLAFSSTNQKVFDLPVNGDVPPSLLNWEGDPNAALSVTTGAAGPTDVNVDYELAVA